MSLLFIKKCPVKWGAALHFYLINLFAFAYSEKETIIELKNVVEMMMDYHLQQVNDERIIKNELTHKVEKYAVQV